MALTGAPIMSLLVIPLTVFLFKSDVFRFVLEDLWLYFGVQYASNPILVLFNTSLRIGLMFAFFMEAQRIFPFLLYFYGLTGQLVHENVQTVLEHAKKIRFVQIKFIFKTEGCREFLPIWSLE